MADNPAVALAYSIAEKQTELFRRVRRNAAARAAERGADTSAPDGAARAATEPRPPHGRTAASG